MLFSEKQHKYINWVGIGILLVGLPLSKVLMTISQIVLLINWLLCGNIKQQITDIKQNKPLLLIIVLFFIHLFGLIWTEDFEYAWQDIRIKLPLFILPLVFSSGFIKPNKNEFHNLLKVYFAAVTIATVLSMFKYFGLIGEIPNSGRELSLFGSHIRFGLMIALAINVGLFLFASIYDNKEKWLYLLGSIWLIVFSFILQSLTGIIAMIVSLIVSVLVSNSIRKYSWLKSGVLMLLLGLFLSGIYYVNKEIKEQLIPKQDQLSSLKDYTKNGTKYGHYVNDRLLENGYYVHINLAYSELEKGWKNRSNLDFKANDKMGQPVKSTLIRFLTSKGLDKDLDAVESLSDIEISAIENGIPNVRYIDISSFELRIKETIWEVGAYFADKNPGGNTLTQRFEYWRMASLLIKENIFFGVGTGDVKQEEFKMFDAMQSVLENKYRKRAHNQYLTMWVSFGVFGFIYFLTMLIYPFFVLPKKEYFLFFSLLIISLLSFLNEDTLETQAGVTFFVGMFGFLLLQPKE